MLNFRGRYSTYFLMAAVLAGAVGLISSGQLMAQTTISTGSIQGTISDPTGAVIPGAAITVSSKEAGASISLKSSGSGTYSSGALLPGEYAVRVESKGFKTALHTVNVQVGVTSPGNVTLELGQETTVITVEAAANVVNTEQATVQGVLTAQQIDQLPINGRNFLDLAALQPGVQIQDGGGFDPTKNGYSGISIGGRYGRSTRIELDGIDISDETVGTTTQNIPVNAIQEFSISQSSLDLSTELTSSGSVNVVTRSGGNSYHGEGFIGMRGDRYAARLGDAKVPFDRQQYGGRFGGKLIKDKLFFFASWERTVQDMQQSVTLSDPFTALSGSFNSPFHESMLVGRLDWNIKSNVRVFYRWTYNQNNNESPFVPNTYEPFSNRDNTPVQAAGLDVATGSWSHSIRFGYTRFTNQIVDSASRKSTVDLAPGVDVHISASGATGCTGGGFLFCSGVNILAPQATLQRNTQIKYDGSKTIGSHIIRYGMGVNRILGGGFAKFYSAQPTFRSNFTSGNVAKAEANPCTNPNLDCSGGASNPLNYPINRLRFGNGQGFFTEIPRFGFPAGGQFDTRFAWYIGDSWKAKRNLTVSFGVRYVRDTGRSDSDLPPLDLLNLWGAGLGNRVNQPNKNFAPQLGIAWDPGKNGKTVIRAGAGLYYENAIFNNILFDRPGRLPTGLFFGIFDLCPTLSRTLPGGTVVDASSMCGQPIGNFVDQAIGLQSVVQGAFSAAGASANPNYLGENYANGGNSTGNNFIAPDYRTPRSWQFNFGIQRELRSGTVLSVDYIRNVGTRSLLAYDTNHIGDARYLDAAAAQAAIDYTNDSYGCAPGIAGIDCAIAQGATMAVDYAANGLDSGVAVAGGYGGSGAAFPGKDSSIGENEMLFPIGRSVYNALQVSLRSNVANPFRGVRNMSIQVGYALSRLEAMAADQDFINGATDYANINHFFGPTGLDRTHQLSFGGLIEFPRAIRLAYTTRVATALPTTLYMPASGDSGEIFRTDVTGDGTTGDVLPGTNVGAFDRTVRGVGINKVIANYNNTVAGTLTPAGQALVGAGLMTEGQLIALGATPEKIQLAPGNQENNDSSLNAGIRLSAVLRPNRAVKSIGERLTIEPSVSVFNVFNFANYYTLDGTLSGGPLSANGTTKANRTNKVFLGSGIFSYGAPRIFEFGVKVTF